MAENRYWSYTDLSVADALVLKVTDDEDKSKIWTYEIASFAASWAVNEIPRATCSLAVGRSYMGAVDPKTDDRAAQIHNKARFRQMTACEVWFNPKKDYHPDGRQWEWLGNAPRRIFDGYIDSTYPRKTNGKIVFTVTLIDKLVDLANSSITSGNSHPLNPASFSAQGIIAASGFSGAGITTALSHTVGAFTNVAAQTDLWMAIKDLLARTAAVVTPPLHDCFDGDAPGHNARALRALARFEGPVMATTVPEDTPQEVRDTAKPYEFGRPLLLDGMGVDLAAAVAGGLGLLSVQEMASNTMWDYLIRQACPDYGLAVIPLIDNALVVADTPTFNGLAPVMDGDRIIRFDLKLGTTSPQVWRTVEVKDYDSFSMNTLLGRPLRTLVVYSAFRSDTNINGQQANEQLSNPHGLPYTGCWTEPSVSVGDGIIRYVEAPAWLNSLVSSDVIAGGLLNGGSLPSAIRPGAGRISSEPLTDTPKIFQRYAHYRFLAETLTNRTGAVGGFLRFDIGPGSVIAIAPTAETFLDGNDELGATHIGCVARVTIVIDAENSRAGTTYQLTHLRTLEENRRTRTSSHRHPLFTEDSIHGNGFHGAPLLKDFPQILWHQ